MIRATFGTKVHHGSYSNEAQSTGPVTLSLFFSEGSGPERRTFWSLWVFWPDLFASYIGAGFFVRFSNELKAVCNKFQITGTTLSVQVRTLCSRWLWCWVRQSMQRKCDTNILMSQKQKVGKAGVGYALGKWMHFSKLHLFAYLLLCIYSPRISLFFNLYDTNLSHSVSLLLLIWR